MKNIIVPNSDTANEKVEKPATIPYIVYESELSRANKREKRHWIAHIVLIVIMFILMMNFLAYDTISYDYAQDGNGLNNINTGEQGGLAYGAEVESTSEAAQE